MDRLTIGPQVANLPHNAWKSAVFMSRMDVRPIVLLLLALVTTWGVLRAQFQLPVPFQEYPGYEYNNFPVPDDYLDKHDWTRARLKYTPFINVHGTPDGYNRWTVDYPRSDRHLLAGGRRRPRLDT